MNTIAKHEGSCTKTWMALVCSGVEYMVSKHQMSAEMRIRKLKGTFSMVQESASRAEARLNVYFAGEGSHSAGG